MSTLTSTTSSTRPSLGSGDVGKSYFETDSRKIIVWDGSAWNEWNYDSLVTPGFNNSFSASFNGSSDYLDVGTISTLTGASQQSVSFWFKSDVAGQLPDWGYRTGATSSYGFIDAGSGQRWFLVRNGASNTYELTSVIPTDTNWHHWVAVFDAGSVAVYVDGSAVSGTSSGTTPTSLASSTGDFYIGKFGNIAYYADGLYDEFCIWNTALDSDDATGLYNTGSPKDPTTAGGGYDKQSSLTHWYRMGDDTNDTGTGGVADGNAITNVENAANNNTNDASVGGGSPTYSSTVPS